MFLPRFNTQPPEGGWHPRDGGLGHRGGFNTQPPEGGWLQPAATPANPQPFQHTAARRRLGCVRCLTATPTTVSTHSRPKAAGRQIVLLQHNRQFQHTAARRRLVDITFRESGAPQFQHTAARRRLGPLHIGKQAFETFAKFPQNPLNSHQDI